MYFAVRFLSKKTYLCTQGPCVALGLALLCTTMRTKVTQTLDRENQTNL